MTACYFGTETLDPYYNYSLGGCDYYSVCCTHCYSLIHLLIVEQNEFHHKYVSSIKVRGRERGGLSVVSSYSF